MLPVEAVRRTYARIARRYDRAVRLFPLFGVRIGHYRREAIRALNVSAGATVVELGCGTGLNFPLLQEVVGPSGRIIGVDLSREMLHQARRRVVQHGWPNVDLCQNDLAEYSFPPDVDGVLSTFAITLSPEYDAVIQRAARALCAGGRMVVVDFKRADSWPVWLLQLAAWLNRSFAVTLDLGERHPWESIARHMKPTEISHYYGGAVYLAAGMSLRSCEELKVNSRELHRPFMFARLFSSSGTNAER
jgi:ubiquinone/menaquinone biosynthesis C-methylase UbiE